MFNFESLRKGISKVLTGPSATGDEGWIQLGSGSAVKSQSYEEVVDVWKKVTWIYACVWAISNLGATVPQHMKRKEDGEWKLLSNHPFLDRVGKGVNELQTWKEFLTGTLVHLEFMGDAYWEVHTRGKTIDGMYLLRPDYMTPVMSESGKRLVKYVWDPGSDEDEAVEFDPDEIVHFRFFNPLSDIKGFGPAQAAEEPALLEQYSQDYSKRHVKNYGVPPGYLTTDSAISENEAQRISDKWRQRDQSQTPVLPKGLDWVRISSDARDLELGEIRNMSREEILGVFNVPPAIVGLVENADYDNYQLQQRHFYTKTIAARLETISQTLNAFFLNDVYDSEVKFEFAPKEAVTESAAQEADYLFKMAKMGGVTANDARRILNIGPPLENGDEPLLGSNFTQRSEATVEENTDEGIE